MRRGVALILPVFALVLVSAWTFERVKPESIGLEVTPLTFSTAGNEAEIHEFPVASPDGKWVAFQRSTDPQVVKLASGERIGEFNDQSNWDIYRVPAAGGEAVRLTDHPALEDQAVWSPDSATLVYRFAGNGSHDLWLMDADGGHQRPLVDLRGSDERTPAFSPDGRKVIFFSNRDGHKWSLYTVDVASRAIERVTQGPGEDKHPQLTPDGREVIFHSDRGGGVMFLSGPGAPPERAMRIFSLDLASGAMRQLSDSAEPEDDRHPFLSPDGRFITYHANLLEKKGAELYAKDGRDLYLMTRDGSRRLDLTAEDSRTFKHPSFSADGTKLYCVFKRRNRAYNVGVIDIRAALTKLTAGDGR